MTTPPSGRTSTRATRSVAFAMAIAVAVGAYATGADPAEMPDPGTALDRLAWIEGAWQRDGRRGVLVETWTRVSANVFEGTGRFVDPESGREATIESLLLVAMGDAVYYVARPRENAYPVPFRMVAFDGTSVTFENPANEFPQRIRYVRGEDGASMTATIEGPSSGDGETREIEFRFRRARP